MKGNFPGKGIFIQITKLELLLAFLQSSMLTKWRKHRSGCSRKAVLDVIQCDAPFSEQSNRASCLGVMSSWVLSTFKLYEEMIQCLDRYIYYLNAIWVDNNQLVSLTLFIQCNCLLPSILGYFGAGIII